MSSNKKYWKSVEELENGSIVEALKITNLLKQFLLKSFRSKEMSSSTSRRDFFKVRWFSTAAATLAACEGPVVKSIPCIYSRTNYTR
jgi:molybdopterin-containing oxidoreductase family iron-sulfur binding subunit